MYMDNFTCWHCVNNSHFLEVTLTLYEQDFITFLKYLLHGAHMNKRNNIMVKSTQQS